MLFMPVARGWPTKKGEYSVMINFLHLNLTADGAIEQSKYRRLKSRPIDC
jgi:hypothetical protein